MSIYRQGPGSANACPRCREALLPAGPGREVLHCETCGGVFADVPSTRRIISTMDRALLEIGFQAALGKPRKQHEPRDITCPECLIAMQQQRIESANCIVDVCPMHGTWFDTGELEDVMRAFARARRHGAHTPGAPPVADVPPIGIVRRAVVDAEVIEPPGERRGLVGILTAFLGG